MLLSIRSYAAHRKQNGLPGGTHGAVRKAIETGRVKLVDGKVDSDQADQDWVRKTDPGKQRMDPCGSGEDASRRHPAVETPAIDRAQAETPAAAEEPESGDASNYQKSRSAREYWESELSRLEVEKETGNLISRESAEKAWGDMVVSTRTKALYLPSQLASRLASESDPITCEEILKDAVHKLLSELSEYTPE
jgi:hypothetical protein